MRLYKLPLSRKYCRKDGYEGRIHRSNHFLPSVSSRKRTLFAAFRLISSLKAA